MSIEHRNGTGRPPLATLRLQLHEGYTFDHARADLPYFRQLGISHLYLSPVSQARRGSTHGYDVVDHAVVDPARGGESAFRALAAAARAAGLGILLDIVPNHMAADPANAWWWDVLTYGRRSQWAGWFDIDWDAPRLPGKVLAPFLAQPYDSAMRAGEIRLRFDQVLGVHIVAHGQPWPLAPASLPYLATARQPGAAGPPEGLERLLADHDPQHRPGRQRLHALLSQQHYLLAWWREAAGSINWRRFFEVNELIGVRVEQDAVFDAVHALPLRFYAEGLIDGLRIDHVDGLARPLAYCDRLYAAMHAAGAQRPEPLAVNRPWIVVEKILANNELLDSRWEAVSGTTGYDFAADVGALLHDSGGETPLFQGWVRLSGDQREPQAWLLDARQEMLDRHFMAERDRLLDLLADLNPGARPALGKALDALLHHYPTYRSYVEDGTRTAADERWFRQALCAAAASLADDAEALALLAGLDLQLGGSAPCSPLAQQAVQRFQQLTPPLAAKSLEDTVFYRYGCLLSRNEVGSDPSVFSLSVEDFHERNLHRSRSQHGNLLATATHDHKRGEDARARLAVLSEIPEEWLCACQQWLGELSNGMEQSGPATAFHYMLLQTMVGSWPTGLSAADPVAVQSYFDRLGAWVVKALREGKQLSSWTEPDAGEEAAWLGRLKAMAPGGAHHGVLRNIEAFVQRLEPGAIANGLIQTVLRMTCPGVPDLYQGAEWRDFSLVDPDNRRPVDFLARAHSLTETLGGEAGRRAPLASGRWPAQAWSDGRVKQAMIAALLALRREHVEAFAGNYEGLRPQGPAADRLLAFSRGGEIVVAVAVNCAARLNADEAGMPVFAPDAGLEGRLLLPEKHPDWCDVLRGRTLHARDGAVQIADLLAGLPWVVLRRLQG